LSDLEPICSLNPFIEMVDKIKKYLEKIEREKNVKILLACETGSRAWGFPSPDSDFDIRLIYAHHKDWYLSLSEKKDNIDLMFENNEIDITGWDLRKSLRLMQKSNPSIIERIQSPTLYKYDAAFLKDINALAKKHYSKIATMHHYLSMAKKFFFELKDQDTYKLKKFFYTLRAATASKWILEKEELPPIEFAKMLAPLGLDNSLLDRINALIALKATVSESYLHQGEKELFQFIETAIAKADSVWKSLPSAKGNAEELDAFFIKMLNENDN